jgi:hypothetical protein
MRSDQGKNFEAVGSGGGERVQMATAPEGMSKME